MRQLSIYKYRCFPCTIKFKLRKNNGVQGWHNSFSSMLNSSIHPLIWKFISALQKEESVNRLKTEQLIAEQEPQKINK